MPETVVVALGGNAILRPGQRGTASEQLHNIRLSSHHIVRMIQLGHRVVITHGNGPQVGNILIQNAEARHLVPEMGLDLCGAQSQGMLGYMIQQSLYNELVAADIEKSVISVLTQTVVDPRDPAFERPTKPIGPFYSEEEARQFMQERGEKWAAQPGKGWRKVVPSPAPIAIVEGETIRRLVEDGIIVIAAGGGGVPVFRGRDYRLSGVDAVVDKDLASLRLALQLRADVLLILTDVAHAALHFGSPEQQDLRRVSVTEARSHYDRGHFGAGSMGPKVRAAIEFVEAGGKRAVITALEQALAGLAGETGTEVVPG